MTVGLNLGITASGNFTAGVTGLDAVDPNNSYFLTYDSGSAIGSGTSADLTFSFWLKMEAETLEGTIIRIEGPGTDILFLNHNGVSETMRFGILDGSWAIDLQIDVSDIAGDNAWHHFVYSRDGSASTHYWYVDGVSKTITVNSGRNSYASHLSFGTYQDVFVLSETVGGSNLVDTPITQLYLSSGFNDISNGATLAKFYNTGSGGDGAVDMGSDGTGSGLSQPELFFTGVKSTFSTNGGTISISMTENGSGSDISTSNGPQF